MKIPGDGFSELAFKTAKIRLWKSDKRFQELCFPGLFFVHYLRKGHCRMDCQGFYNFVLLLEVSKRDEKRFNVKDFRMNYCSI